MPLIKPVTGRMLIRPDDLFKYHGNTYWERAKFSVVGWLGKSVKAFTDFGKEAGVGPNFTIIRTDASDTELQAVGIFVALPDASMRHFWQSNMGKLGKKRDYPKDFKLTFGKYKGQPISELIYENKQYLEWIYNENVKCMTEAHHKILGEWLGENS